MYAFISEVLELAKVIFNDRPISQKNLLKRNTGGSSMFSFCIMDK